MVRLSGACCGMLVFSAMILRGMAADNPTELILQRALVGLFGGTALGMVLGAIAMVVVSDNLQIAGADTAGDAQPPPGTQDPPSAAGNSAGKEDKRRNGSGLRPRTQ